MQYSENTEKAYDKAWNSYVGWCAHRGSDPLDCVPERLAAYLSDCAGRLAFNSLRAHLTAITRNLRAAGVAVDTKNRSIAKVLSQAKEKDAEPVRLAVPLTTKQLHALTRHLSDGVIGARDRALLLVGYWLGLNLHDLVRINCEDLAVQKDSILVQISGPAKHKLHRDYILRPSLITESCPVRAVNAWLALRGTSDGPLFPRILKGGKLTPHHISNVYINLLVKRLAEASGFGSERLSGRSLRTGFSSATSFNRTGRRLREVSKTSSDFESPGNEQSDDGDLGPPALSIGPQGIGPISFDSSARWEIRLGLMIDELSRLQSAVVSERIKHFGITRIQYFALSELSNAGALTQSALARRLNLTDVGVSGLVTRMVAGGWVIRQSDGADNRIRRLYLTDKASQLIKELRHVVEEVTTATFRNIAENDGYDILRILAGMRAVLLALSNSGRPHP